MKKLLGILILGLIFSGSTFAKKTEWGVFSGLAKKGGIDSIIALCSNEKNLNKVTVIHFNNLSEYKKNASFRNGECNYVVDRFMNPRLFQFLFKTKLKKGKYVIKKKYIEERVAYTNEIYYVTPEGKFIEVVSLEFLKGPTQTQEVVEKSDRTPRICVKGLSRKVHYLSEVKKCSGSGEYIISKKDTTYDYYSSRVTKPSQTQEVVKIKNVERLNLKFSIYDEDNRLHTFWVEFLNDNACNYTA